MGDLEQKILDAIEKIPIIGWWEKKKEAANSCVKISEIWCIEMFEKYSQYRNSGECEEPIEFKEWLSSQKNLQTI